MKYQPKQLLILDIYENNAYEIQNELKRLELKHTEIITLIASIREERMRSIETYLPSIVFHTAAHKHVPLMEMNQGSDQKYFGTYNVVKCSDQYKVKRICIDFYG